MLLNTLWDVWYIREITHNSHRCGGLMMHAPSCQLGNLDFLIQVCCLARWPGRSWDDTEAACLPHGVWPISLFSEPLVHVRTYVERMWKFSLAAAGTWLQCESMRQWGKHSREHGGLGLGLGGLLPNKKPPVIVESCNEEEVPSTMSLAYRKKGACCMF